MSDPHPAPAPTSAASDDTGPFPIQSGELTTPMTFGALDLLRPGAGAPTNTADSGRARAGCPSSSVVVGDSDASSAYSPLPSPNIRVVDGTRVRVDQQPICLDDLLDVISLVVFGGGVGVILSDLASESSANLLRRGSGLDPEKLVRIGGGHVSAPQDRVAMPRTPDRSDVRDSRGSIGSAIRHDAERRWGRYRPLVTAEAHATGTRPVW